MDRLKFISVLCDGFLASPDDEVSLVTLEDISEQMPPYVYDQVNLDDVTDIQEL